MRKRRLTLFVFLIISLIMAGCGNNQPQRVSASESETSSTNNVEIEKLLTENGCVACHALEAGAASPTTGPNMAGLATTSLERIQNPNYTGAATTAEEYIRESILDPKVYIVDGFDPLMPATYDVSIEPENLDQIVAYLMTLK
ncbi:MAG: cytochrome c [Anaerolineae bacterium]|nr:cytochrome c [Anaerolineae bacterium]